MWRCPPPHDYPLTLNLHKANNKLIRYYCVVGGHFGNSHAGIKTLFGWTDSLKSEYKINIVNSRLQNFLAHFSTKKSLKSCKGDGYKISTRKRVGVL